MTARMASRITAALIALALTAAACTSGDGEGRPYKDPAERFYLELPEAWNLYPEELGELRVRPFNPTAPQLNGVLFDRFPQQDPGNFAVAVAEADYPIGMATVRPVSTEERDFISRAHLAQSIIPYRDQPQYQELLKEDFTFGENVEGVRMAVQFRDEETNDLAVVLLESVTDADDSNVYSIAIGCSMVCFQRYQQEIVDIVSSWKVNTKQ